MDEKNKEDMQTLVVSEANCQPRWHGLLPENNRKVLLGPSFSGETPLLLKVLSRISDRNVLKFTRSPLEQYFNSKIKINEIGEEIESVNQWANATEVFDGFKGSSKCKFINWFFIKGRHQILNVYYPSQSYFKLPKKIIRNISIETILFIQTLMDIGYKKKDVGGYDMSYMNSKNFAEKPGKMNVYIYLSIDLNGRGSSKILYMY